jgi:hypothetical protein
VNKVSRPMKRAIQIFPQYESAKEIYLDPQWDKPPPHYTRFPVY